MATTASASVLTALFNSLSTIKPDNPPLSTTTTALGALPIKSILSTLTAQDLSTVKNVLLTLHFLFPHELLPALDLLDRRLVNRLVCRGLRQSDPPTNDLETSANEHLRRSSSRWPVEVLYVQSASAVTESKAGGGGHGRFRNAWKRNATRVYYEVRLDAWNCSCAAFAQSEMKLILNMSLSPLEQSSKGQQEGVTEVAMAMAENEVKEEGRGYVFGGNATNHNIPVPTCKHILAAAIAVAAPEVFGIGGMQTREVSVEELAGWAAGWGET